MAEFFRSSLTRRVIARLKASPALLRPRVFTANTLTCKLMFCAAVDQKLMVGGISSTGSIAKEGSHSSSTTTAKQRNDASQRRSYLSQGANSNRRATSHHLRSCMD